MNHNFFPQGQPNGAGHPSLVGPTDKPYTSLLECNGTFEGPYALAYENPPSSAAVHASDGRASEPTPDIHGTGQTATAELSAEQAEHATEPALPKNGVNEVALRHIGAWAYEPGRA